ncbi:MAG: two-component sensor histidine kinase [Candidatus Marinimicrobia bacterium]|nr:two-component sensor histidine kinase [Candidatus Neomarinimicrobiota bacterium]
MNYFSLYIKIFLFFLLYLFSIYFLEIQLFTSNFYIINFILCFLIISFVYYNNMKFNQFYNKFDFLYDKILQKNKSHKNLNSILESLDEFELFFLNQYSELDKLKNTRSKFLQDISHELKTPIFLLQGFIDTLIEQDKTNKNEIISKIKKQSNRIENLFLDILMISMIESEDIKLDIQKIKLSDILTEIYSDFSERLVERGDKLIIPDSTDINVFIDKEKILTVFSNLISNAINYSDSGDVIVTVKKYKNNVNVRVIDHGIGIPEKYFDYIFNRFYRVDKHRSNTSGGTGLGLAIVKHILLAHNIEINIKSTEGVGSEFSFMLPINNS